MRITAIICEFNPLHNGHAMLLNRARQNTNADAILCIMSGNFTQRAEPAIVDSRTRATMALKCGADLVVELPALYSTACADKFSEASINIANSIKHVTHLAFGSECGDIKLLQSAAQVQASESKEFKLELKQHLDNGKSYANALSLATQNALDNDFDLNMPNDILGIEYIKQLYKSNSSIKPITISRQGSNHHDKIAQGEFCSATALRTLLNDKNFAAAKKVMPKIAFDIIKDDLSKHSVDFELFNFLTLASLRLNDLSNCPDSGEGLENKLKKSALECTNLLDAFDKTKSKRYTMARIRRLCLQVLFGITHYPNISDLSIPAKLIGINANLKTKLLPLLPKNIIVQNKDFDLYINTLKKEQQADCQYIESINEKAGLLYPLLQKKNGLFYKNQPLICNS